MSVALRFFLVFILFSKLAQAASILDQAFVGTTGESKRISALASKEKPVLIAFWATWCLPCKEEMHRIETYPNLKKNFTLVALSVDEINNWPKAQALLAELSWPDLSINDPSGSYFYSIRKSGQLPFVIIVDAAGNVLQTLNSLDDDTLKKLSTVQEAKTERLKPWNIYFDSLYRKNYFDDPDQSEAWGNLSGVQWRKDLWSAGVEYQVLYTRNRLLKTTDKNWEDQIGAAFLEWQDISTRLRIGDDQVKWLGGEMINLATNKSQNERLSLQGIHTSYHRQAWSTQAIYGRVNSGLFPLELDPLKDNSVSLPRETIGGLETSHNFSNNDLKSNLHIGIAQYKRDSDAQLGYPNAYSDIRIGSGLQISHNQTGGLLQFSSMDAQETLSTQKTRNVSASILDTQVWTAHGDWRWPLSYINSNNPGPRTWVPFLIEDPGTPLDGSVRQQWKLQPQIQKQILIEPGLVLENVDDPATAAEQQSVLLFLSDPKADWKVNFVGQNSLQKNSNEKSKDIGVITTFPLHKYWSMQGTVKTHSSTSTSTTSHSETVIIGFQLWRMLNLESPTHRWVINLQATRQDPYYQAVGGILRTWLTSVELLDSGKNFNAQVAYGSRPGVTECSSGACVKKSALNGLQITLNYNNSF